MLAGVSRVAYYRDWNRAKPLVAETQLRGAVQRLALANRHYGYRRIGAMLRREGHVVNHKKLVGMMREDNLLCLRKPAFRPATTDSNHRWRVWPNLARRMTPMACNRLWVADITYVHLAESFVYLAVVLDAYSRKVVGWALQSQKRYDEAVNVYTELTRHSAAESAARAQLNVGVCRLEQNRPADALKALLAVPLTYDYPDCSAAAWYQAARAQLKSEKPQEA